MHYALNERGMGGPSVDGGRLATVDNVVRGGASTRGDLPFLIVEGGGDLELFERDISHAFRWPPDEPAGHHLQPRSQGHPPAPRSHSGPAGFKAQGRQRDGREHGAAHRRRPWERDALSKRLAQVRGGKGHGEVGGYPHFEQAREVWGVEKPSVRTHHFRRSRGLSVERSTTRPLREGLSAGSIEAASPGLDSVPPTPHSVMCAPSQMGLASPAFRPRQRVTGICPA